MEEEYEDDYQFNDNNGQTYGNEYPTQLLQQANPNPTVELHAVNDFSRLFINEEDEDD